jgi:hypothetical protein
LNKTFSEFLSYSLALDFQNIIALLAIPHIFHNIKIAIMKNNINIIIVGSISAQNFLLVLSFIKILVVISGFLSHNSFNESLFGNITISLGIFVIPFSSTVLF